MKVSTTAERLNQLMQKYDLRQADVLKRCDSFSNGIKVFLFLEARAGATLRVIPLLIGFFGLKLLTGIEPVLISTLTRLFTEFKNSVDRILDRIFCKKSRPEEGHSSDLLFGVRINFELGRSST